MLGHHVEQGLLLTFIPGQHLILFWYQCHSRFCPIICHTQPIFSLLTLQLNAVLFPRITLAVLHSIKSCCYLRTDNILWARLLVFGVSASSSDSEFSTQST